MVIAYCCSALLAFAIAQEPVQLEVEVVRVANSQPVRAGEVVYQGELLTVNLLLSFEPQFHDQQLLNPYRMPLDLPVELTLPWVLENPNWKSVAKSGTNKANETNGANGAYSSGGSSLVVNHDKSFAFLEPDSEDGRIRYRLQRTIQITNNQAFDLPAAAVKVVWATQFEDDFARGRVPMDRQEANFASGSIALLATAVLTEGRPATYLGAVGKFELDFTSELRMEGDGDTVNATGTTPQPAIWDVQLHAYGKGSLSKSMLPSFETQAGLHVQGQRFEHTDNGLRLVAEVQTSSPASAILLPPWTYFDPSPPAHFVTLGKAANSVNRDSDQVESCDWRWPWIIGSSVLLILALLRLRRERPANSSARTRSTTKSIARPIVKSTAPKPTDFVQQLADYLSCTRAQVYAQDLGKRLSEAGVASELVDEITTAMRSIVHAKYAGKGQMPAANGLDSILKRLA